MYQDFTALKKCTHCGQWAAVFTACVHCGAPVDPDPVQDNRPYYDIGHGPTNIPVPTILTSISSTQKGQMMSLYTFFWINVVALIGCVALCVYEDLKRKE